MRNRMTRASIEYVGDKPKHKEFYKRLASKLKDTIEAEFQRVREAGDWEPHEAAGCGLRALTELIASMLNMIALHNRPDIDDQDGTQPALTRDEYESLVQDITAVIQKHINQHAKHFLADN